MTSNPLRIVAGGRPEGSGYWDGFNFGEADLRFSDLTRVRLTREQLKLFAVRWLLMADEDGEKDG